MSEQDPRDLPEPGEVESAEEIQTSALALLGLIEESARITGRQANAVAELIPTNALTLEGHFKRMAIRVNPSHLDKEGRIKVTTINLCDVMTTGQDVILSSLREMVILSEYNSGEPQVEVQGSLVALTRETEDFGILQILDASKKFMEQKIRSQIEGVQRQAIAISQPESHNPKIN